MFNFNLELIGKEHFFSTIINVIQAFKICIWLL